MLPESSVEEFTTSVPGTNWYAWQGTVLGGDRDRCACSACRGVLDPLREERPERDAEE